VWSIEELLAKLNSLTVPQLFKLHHYRHVDERRPPALAAPFQGWRLRGLPPPTAAHKRRFTAPHRLEQKVQKKYTGLPEKRDNPVGVRKRSDSAAP
jgi:hypothetical protein